MLLRNYTNSPYSYLLQLIEHVGKNNSGAALASVSPQKMYVTQPHTARTAQMRALFVVRKYLILFGKKISYGVLYLMRKE